MHRRAIATLLLIGILTPSGHACLWDFDTIDMERSKFPSVLELIVGKFLRHSKAFYEWRIEDRTTRLENASDEKQPALYDDLAVAYEKTGQTQKAIELTLKLEELFPGRYETAANLGTFYIHSGQFEEGLKHIVRALEINPEAHFGRERYQKLLVEYVRSKQLEDGPIPLPLEPDPENYFPVGFAAFVLSARDIDFKTSANQGRVANELSRARKGVLGMMRFGDHTSPVLLEALADLLVAAFDREKDAKQLATRALLRASQAVEGEARQAYRSKADRYLKMQLRPPELAEKDYDQMLLTDVENHLADEVKDADAWFAQVAANESRWVAEGSNPDQEFRATYRVAPESPSQVLRPTRSRNVSRMDFAVIAIASTGLVLAGVILVVKRLKVQG